MTDQTSPKLKLERALEHLDSLRREIDEFVEANTISGLATEEVDGFSVNFSLPVVPARLSLTVGDAVHNMRTAFEHLMRQLILRNGHQPTRQSGFPVSTNSKYVGHTELFLKDHKPQIGDCSYAAQLEIERVQPYHRGVTAETDYLRILHELDRVDKHQLLNVVRVQITLKPDAQSALYVGDELVERPEQSALMLAPNEAGGAEFGAVGVTETELRDHLQKIMSVRLGFGQETPAPGAPIEILWAIHEHAASLILRFDRFFS